jgi:hypothetical protein
VLQENPTSELGKKGLSINIHQVGSQSIDSTRSDDNMLPTQSNQGAAKRKASNDLSERLTKQTKEAPSAVTLAESTQLDDLLQLRSRATTVEELGQKVEAQQQVLHWCMKKLIDRGEAMTSEDSKNPKDVPGNLYDRLETRDEELNRYKDIVIKLIGGPDFAGNKFPQPQTCPCAGRDGRKPWRTYAWQLVWRTRRPNTYPALIWPVISPVLLKISRADGTGKKSWRTVSSTSTST